MPPLHWHPTQGYLKEHGIVATVTCKNGHACSLRVGPGKHSVSAEGVMMPSLGCPADGCDGHEMPGSVLEGWAGGVAQAKQEPRPGWNWLDHA